MGDRIGVLRRGEQLVQVGTPLRGLQFPDEHFRGFRGGALPRSTFSLLRSTQRKLLSFPETLNFHCTPPLDQGSMSSPEREPGSVLESVPRM